MICWYMFNDQHNGIVLLNQILMAASNFPSHWNSFSFFNCQFFQKNLEHRCFECIRIFVDILLQNQSWWRENLLERAVDSPLSHKLVVFLWRASRESHPLFRQVVTVFLSMRKTAHNQNRNLKLCSYLSGLFMERRVKSCFWILINLLFTMSKTILKCLLCLWISTVNMDA